MPRIITKKEQDEFEMILEKYQFSIKMAVDEIQSYLSPKGPVGAGNIAITEAYSELGIHSLNPDASPPRPTSPFSPHPDDEKEPPEDLTEFKNTILPFFVKRSTEIESEIHVLKAALKEKLREGLTLIKRAQVLILKVEESIEQLKFELKNTVDAEKQKRLEDLTESYDQYHSIMPNHPLVEEKFFQKKL